jgi:protein subunit release factor B
MEEIMSRAECYIKDEESNAEKKARDAKERDSTRGDKRNYYPLPTRDRGTFKRQERRTYNLDNITPLNTRPERIYKEFYQFKLIPDPP